MIFGRTACVWWKKSYVCSSNGQLAMVEKMHTYRRRISGSGLPRQRRGNRLEDRSTMTQRFLSIGGRKKFNHGGDEKDCIGGGSSSSLSSYPIHGHFITHALHIRHIFPFISFSKRIVFQCFGRQFYFDECVNIQYISLSIESREYNTQTQKRSKQHFI